MTDSTTSTATSAVSGSFADITNRLASFAPRLILSLVILVIGWIIALIIGNIIATIAQAIGFDSLSRRIGLTRLLDSAGVEKSVSAILGQLATWILVVVVFMAGAEVLGVQSIQPFLNSVLGYSGHVIAAAAMLLVGLIFANFLADMVHHASDASGLDHAAILSAVTRNAVIIFTVIAVLDQLQIASDIMRAVLYGFIAMAAIAGGLAFGLGGQKTAGKVLDNLEDELKKKK